MIGSSVGKHQHLFRPLLNIQIRNATKKSGGSSSNGRDSNPKYLGLKCGDGAFVNIGNIIAKQRGTKWHAGDNVCISKDHSVHALVDGKARFHYDLATQKRYISVDNDGGFPIHLFYPSRDRMKQMLADRVDALKYVNLKPMGKYKYIRELIAVIDKELKLQKEAFLAERCTQAGVRKFDLVDLTLI